MFKRNNLQSEKRVVELFAGVGGFRLGLEAAGWTTVFSNQWEPSTKRQHASEVYVANFGNDGHSNEDIATIETIPREFEMLVGGFPCQDYSVAKSRSSSSGIEGKKGVLWWEILRLVHRHTPRFIFLENVDRLLKSPAAQRGRDFAIMLRSLGSAGYTVEWRVVNAADYGFPQRRRRVFIVAYRDNSDELASILTDTGVLTKTFAVHDFAKVSRGSLSESLLELSTRFGVGLKASPFYAAGVYRHGDYITGLPNPRYAGPRSTLSDILLPIEECDEELFIPPEQLDKWKYLKGAKAESRVHSSGFEWSYKEGPMAFPDSLDAPSRTILTGEGGKSPSRFKHVVSQGGRLRRLAPVELERLNGFPDDWTESGDGPMSNSRRAFFMGNALVVGLVEAVGIELARRLEGAKCT